jgi:hypothetical protein
MLSSSDAYHQEDRLLTRALSAPRRPLCQPQPGQRPSDRLARVGKRRVVLTQDHASPRMGGNPYGKRWRSATAPNRPLRMAGRAWAKGEVEPTCRRDSQGLSVHVIVSICMPVATTDSMTCTKVGVDGTNERTGRGSDRGVN